MEDHSWERLESFVRDEIGLSQKKRVTADMLVMDDLGQEGDEADLFMEHFFETFGVDPGDYDFRRYFLMEGEGLLYHFFVRVVMRKKHTFKREPLTVGMLHAALLSGKWDSEALARGR